MPAKSNQRAAKQSRRNELKAETSRAGGSRPRAWGVALVLALAVGVVYGRALDAPLIFDDSISIVRNQSIVSLWPLVGNEDQRGPLNPAPDLPTAGRPLVNLSFAVNYCFGGLDLFGYHVVNVVLHFCAAMLVWAITRRTLQLPYFAGEFQASAGWLAFGAALVWALHPLQTEAVIYATQRTELMMALFYLATLYCSLRYWSDLPLPPGEGRVARDSPWRGEGISGNQSHRVTWLILATLACLCGMASKEVMVSAPLMVLLFERTFIAGSISKALRQSWPLYVGLTMTLLLLLALNISAPRANSAGFNLGPPAYVWWMTQCQVLLMYLKLAIWPSPLLIHYELPYLTTFAQAWMYVVPVLLLGIATLVLLWRNTPTGYLGTWVFAILSPTSVVPILTEMAAERRIYLPLAAIVVLMVVGGYRLARRISGRRAVARQKLAGIEFPLAAIGAPVLLIALVYILVSAKRANAYHQPIALWEDVLRHQPVNAIAHENIGFHLDQAGNTPEAIRYLRAAIHCKPDSARTHYSLAVLLTKTGANDEAATQFAEASRIKPDDMNARINLAAALLVAGRYGESIDVSRAALELSPNELAIYNNLGLALQKAGKFPEAIDALQRVLQLNPQALDIYKDIADTYVLANQREKAVAALEHGIEVARAAGDVENTEKLSDQLEVVRSQSHDRPQTDQRKN